MKLIIKQKWKRQLAFAQECSGFFGRAVQVGFLRVRHIRAGRGIPVSRLFPVAPAATSTLSVGLQQRGLFLGRAIGDLLLLLPLLLLLRDASAAARPWPRPLPGQPSPACGGLCDAGERS